MAPTILQLRPDLNAAAYLIEIMIAEALFLGPYKKRNNFAARYTASGLLLLILGTVTGIPALAGFPRFLWFFAAMAGCIAAVCFCYEEDIFTLTSACVAGFAAQHIANKFTILLGLVPMIKWIADQSITMHAVFEVLVFSYVYLVIFMFFGRHRTNAKSNLHLQLLSLVIVFTCIGVNRLVVDHAAGDVYFEIAACLYAIMCCVFALIIQFTITKWQQADTERLLTAQLFSESKKQYEQWSVNAGMIKHWIHDLRHLMNRIENLASQKQVDIPDISRVKAAVDRISPTAKTGNDALDVLLQNMDDLCRQNNIELQCVAYADCLKYFDGMKLYFLFANAIDNAMESVSGIEDPEKRLIDISIRAFGDSASIHIWNYFSGPITFNSGLPVTNKGGEAHGFGMKSMQRIVDEFDGVMHAHTEGEIFNLDIMLPVPEVKQ
ncbi:MAG: ATP-binding protein [Lachnospiraceae bacterium]|nr:ATP-binding protein [Lachnospiraceae bacterium]